MDENGTGGGGINVLGDLWDIAKLRLRGEVQAKNVEGIFGQDARFAVDEYGQAYLRGNASTRTSLASTLEANPLLVVAAIALSAGLLFYALKD